MEGVNVPPTGRIQERSQTPTERWMKGILAMLVDEREARAKDKDATRTEVRWRTPGLSTEDIVAVTGRKPNPIRKSIGRARGK